MSIHIKQILPVTLTIQFPTYLIGTLCVDNLIILKTALILFFKFSNMLLI